MNIASFLPADNICPDLTATDKVGVLRELTHKLAECHAEIDEAKIVKALAERERLGSTGIENGVAIPHTKLPGLNRIYALFGRSRAGVDFESIDGKPSHLFFLLVAPDKKIGRHLAALELVSRLLQSDVTRQKLLEVEAVELFDAICAADTKG